MVCFYWILLVILSLSPWFGFYSDIETFYRNVSSPINLLEFTTIPPEVKHDLESWKDYKVPVSPCFFKLAHDHNITKHGKRGKLKEMVCAVLLV